MARQARSHTARQDKAGYGGRRRSQRERERERERRREIERVGDVPRDVFVANAHER